MWQKVLLEVSVLRTVNTKDSAKQTQARKVIKTHSFLFFS